MASSGRPDTSAQIDLRRRPFTAIGLMLSTAMLLASCGSGNGSAPAVADKDLVYESKLFGLLSSMSADMESGNAEEQVAKCMTERGWEYTPIKMDGALTESDLAPGTALNKLFDEEFRSTFGYGISTAYSDDGKVKKGAPGYEISQLTAQSDPNAEYLASLSPDEKSRYYKDLFGSDPTSGVGLIPDRGESAGAGNADDPNGGDGGSDLDTGTGPSGTSGSEGDILGGIMDAFSGSCAAKAMPAGASDMSRLSELFTKLSKAMSKAGLDDDAILAKKYPELDDAEEAWTTCMSSAGFKFESVNGARDSIQERFDKLGGSGGLPEIPDLIPSSGGSGEVPADAANPNPPVQGGTPTTSVDSESAGDQAGGFDVTGFGAGFDPSQVDLDALHKLQKDELALAAADYKCQRSACRPIYVKVRAKAEDKVLKDNDALVTELKKMLSSTSAGG